MGQFLGWQSYDRYTVCEKCGERWESDEEDEHFCEEEFVKQSEETIEEMKEEKNEDGA